MGLLKFIVDCIDEELSPNIIITTGAKPEKSSTRSWEGEVCSTTTHSYELKFSVGEVPAGITTHNDELATLMGVRLQQIYFAATIKNLL